MTVTYLMTYSNPHLFTPPPSRREFLTADDLDQLMRDAEAEDNHTTTATASASAGDGENDEMNEMRYARANKKAVAAGGSSISESILIY